MVRGAILLLALAGCAPAPATRGGIVSTNPCADAMLVRLVPASRIAAISRYSQDAAATSIPLALADRFRATAGTAEEVIALRPSLVVTSSFTAPATLAAYARAGLRTLVLDSPTSVAASEAQVRTLATAVVAPARGEAMVAGIERALAASRPPSPARPAALLFLSGDLANGSGTLLDELLRRTGFRNAAADYGLVDTGTLPIETIATHPPDVVLSPGDGRTATLRRRVLAADGRPVREAAFSRAMINCGGPTIAAAADRLAVVRRAIAS